MNNQDMTEFAENLWNNYIKPKIEQEFTKEVSYYRATVVSKNDDGTLTVKVPFDGERTINRTVALEEHIDEGDQVIICRFGNGNVANNHVVIAKADDNEWMLGGTAEPVETEIGLKVLLGGYSVSGLVSESTLSAIRSWATYSNSGLTSITMPQVTEIGDYAFTKCENLKIADFASCMHIGSSAFQSCYNLTSLYLDNTSQVTSLIGYSVFDSTPIGGYSDIAGQYGSVYVPSSLYAAFCSATNWSVISARIVPV